MTAATKPPMDDLDFALSCFVFQCVLEGLYGPELQAHPEAVERALFEDGGVGLR